MSEQDPPAQQQFRLTFSGDLAPGVTREQVLADLGRLFNRPAEDLLPLMTGDQHVLKVAPTAEALEPFRSALVQAGAIAHIRAPAQETPAEAAPPAANGSAAPDAPCEPASSAAADESGADPGGTARKASIARYSLGQFLRATRQRDSDQGRFELEGERFLEVNLDDEIWIKAGAMVAYTGDVTFEREGLLEKGFKRLLKKSVTGEGARLTRASGIGTIYLADSGKKITVLQLEGEALVVNGNDILAFETSIDWDIQVLKKMSAVIAGGLFNVRLQGMGMVAITTHHDPLTLDVRHAYPVFCDPHATVAWSASLEPRFKTDVSLKTFLGRGSGESIQMCFEGEGFVVVQPYEESTFQRR